MGLLEGSPWPKIAALCLVLGFLMYLVAFGAPNWAETNPKTVTRKEYIGLWRYCTSAEGGYQHCDDFININTSAWMMAAQSFMTLALFGLLASLGAVCAYALVPAFDGDARMLSVCLAVTGITSIFLLIGVATFGGKYETYFYNKEPALDFDGSCRLSWAFGVAVVSFLLTFASTMLMVLEMLMGGKEY